MRHIPNILSTLRILIIPFFIVALSKDEPKLAGYILLTSGLTDILEGFLARTSKRTPNIGAQLDSFADKLTHATVAFSFMIYLENFDIYY